MTWGDIVFLLPEIVLSIGACLLLIFPVIGRRGETQAAKWLLIGLLIVTAVTVIACSWAVEGIDQSRMFANMFAMDGFSIFFKLVLIAAVGMVALLSADFLTESRYSAAEYY